MQPVQSVSDLHFQRFGSHGRAFQAPGRVNLIGEHTDTSEGFVMPAAIDFCMTAVISDGKEDVAVIHSENLHETIPFDLKNFPTSARRHWSDYPAGVIWSLQQQGIACKGFNMTLRGNVPQGSGLSSSAALEVAVATAILGHQGIQLAKPEIARLCQKAENGFVGTQCGIMDQFISCCGTKDHALLLDCRSLTYELLPLPSSLRMVICNTMVQHSNAGGEYNNRRADVEASLKILRSHIPEIKTLRDATEEQMLRYASEMTEGALRRCRHVISENRRALEAAQALRGNNFVRFGQLMHEAHLSMGEDYEASCREADTLVELAMKQPGCYGARITGAGFGGCTVNVVEAKQANAFVEAMSAGYQQATGIQAEIYLSHASNGAGPLEEN